MNAPSGSGCLRIAAMGDVMLDREVGRRFCQEPEAFALPDIRRILSGHDLVFANLENPVGRRGAPHPKQDPHVAFRCLPETLGALKSLGVNVVSVANNHMLDYGPETLADTLAHLDEYGLPHVGCGRNYEEANAPLLLNVAGQKVAFLAYVFIYSASTERAHGNQPGLSDHRIHRILPRIRELRSAGYRVIVSIHWGLEYSFYPLRYQRLQAQRMIDHGAELILGHGPHYVQGIERYNGADIVHSLGNFIFDEPYPFANESFIYSATLSEQRTVEARTLYPVLLRRGLPELANGARGQRLKTYIDVLGTVYARKPRRFWQDQNDRYLSDTIKRVFRMRSTKFLFLPPPSFYTDLGLHNVQKKLRGGLNRLMSRSERRR